MRDNFTVGIVGNGSDKFTELGEQRARTLIRWILEERMEYLDPYKPIMVSGHSPVGGIDIWAEEVAEALGCPMDLKIPQKNQWNPPGEYGYKARNLDIARSDMVHVILADVYPAEYTGRKFDLCYHCASMGRDATNHVKSGGCWTGKHAKNAVWHIVSNY